MVSNIFGLEQLKLGEPWWIQGVLTRTRPWQHVTPPPSFNSIGSVLSSASTTKSSAWPTNPFPSLHPQYLTDLLQPYTPPCALRSSDSGILSNPSTPCWEPLETELSVLQPPTCRSLPFQKKPSINPSYSVYCPTIPLSPASWSLLVVFLVCASI